MVIDRKQLARTKVADLQNGRSAYAETREMTALIKKELQSLNIDVHEDVTSFGSWFIPKTQDQL
ncbi:hypothetical protein [Guptibacillus hwajinpoensis]|uniref:Serine/threonine protein kinase HipA of HipAB toxin-antitoxin module n=1 Tax=Guptibacillus hwajinpoensis TaxID=208199 RepID=A0ABU0JW29_9BACL|nr:hypothetical protein [Alkalihalobacillus hemicentroti]MDQ0481308.1 serine/threonine protein kinase HipA of HipAB toxin-antitoxin module [Alkalihalobacillus hemicentroti]